MPHSREADKQHSLRMQPQQNRKGNSLRRATIAIVLVFSMVIGALLLISRRNPEPEYKGKRLGDWVTLNARKSVMYAGPPGTNTFGAVPRFPYRRAAGSDATSDDPEEALRHFGTNALPWLIRALQYERPPWKTKFWILLHSLPVSKTQQRSWSRAAISEMMRGNDAVSAFHTLGDVATPAIPALTRLMFTARDEQVSRRAMQSLAGIGTPGVPALSRALTNFAAPESFRDNAVEALAEMEMQALPAVPMLIQWLQDPNKQVAKVAVTALGELALWPNVVVPALTNKLQDNALRRDVIEALGSFEKDGAPGVPYLLSFLTDTNAEIVASAASALGDIGEQSETATPALAKLLLENPDETVRAAAAASLSQFEQKARPAIPILRAALNHPDKDVRESAASILESISGNATSTNATTDAQLPQ